MACEGVCALALMYLVVVSCIFVLDSLVLACIGRPKFMNGLDGYIPVGGNGRSLRQS